MSRGSDGSGCLVLLIALWAFILLYILLDSLNIITGP